MSAVTISEPSLPIAPAAPAAQRPAPEAPARSPSVSVVIPVHNGGAGFRMCLESVRGSRPEPIEIIVVCDGGSDGSAQLAAEWGARVIRLGRRSGPASARNAGGRAAAGDVLLFLDADVTVPPGLIGTVADAFAADPAMAAMIGSYDEHPHEPNFLSQYKNLLHHFVHQEGNEQASTFWGACGAVRREVFLAHGGFDEAYLRPCIEDIELGYRLSAASHRIRLMKGVQVKHLKRWTPLGLLQTDLFYRALPWTQLILRDGRLINDLNLRRSHRASVAMSYGMLAALPAALWQPWLLLVPAVLVLALIALDLRLLTFFRQKHGTLFAVRAAAWHWFYHLYCGVGFVLGWLMYRFRRPARPRRPVPSDPPLAIGPHEA